MSALGLDNQLCFALYAAQRKMVQAYREELGQLGLTYPQYLVLLVLWDEDGVGVGQLGERLMLDSGTLTPVLKRMEAQRLLRRERSRSDERRVEVYLTQGGKALRLRASRVPDAMLHKSKLSLEEAQDLKAVLRRLTLDLDPHPGGKS